MGDGNVLCLHIGMRLVQTFTGTDYSIASLEVILNINTSAILRNIHYGRHITLCIGHKYYLWYSILWQSINRIPCSACRVYCLNVKWSRQLRIVYKPLRVVTVFIVINIVLLHIILPRVASVSFPPNINNKQKIPVGRCLCFRRRSL